MSPARLSVVLLSRIAMHQKAAEAAAVFERLRKVMIASLGLFISVSPGVCFLSWS